MPTFPELIQEDSIEGLKTWEFNLWDLQEQDLLPLLKEMYEPLGCDNSLLLCSPPPLDTSQHVGSNRST
jgi:hypothetical protein